ncbi:MAG: DUF6105 family protein [Rhizobiaceae bacterium]
MRYILLLWFAPLAFFWGWYGLSAYDINMGMVFFSRDLHDAVFAVYGNTLGVSPDKIPPMIAGASIVDSAILGAIAAFRWRASWFPQARAWVESKYAYYFGSEQVSEQDFREDEFETGFAPELTVSKVRPQSTALPAGPVLPAE